MKRFFCILLAVLMLACAVPAFAAEASPFSDVKTSRWSYKAIKYAYEMKYMDGIGGGKFGPAGTMTRAMVATVLYRKAGSPAVSFSNDFSDVSSGKWYSNAVIWAKSNGIVEGYSDGTFQPSGEITREQLAAMFFRFAGTVGYDTRIKGDLSAFPDASKTHSYAKNALTWATARGFITGVTSGKTDLLDPRGMATREQFATIIKRFDDAGPNYALEYAEPQIISSYTSPEYPLVTDADFYVSPDGDDNASGTDASHPFASFERARDAVRELKQTKTSGDIVVAFKAGDYGALDNVTFTSGDSGREDQRIVYRAYGDGEVKFSNGIVIPDGSFTKISSGEKKLFPEEAGDHIFKVSLAGKIDKFDQRTSLIGGDGFCWEARFPNKFPDGTDRVYTDMTTTVDERASIRIIGPLAYTVSNFTTYEGLKITGYLRTGWFQDTFPVKSYDKNTGIITFDFENFDFDGIYDLDSYVLAYEGRMADTVFFHNLAEFLDERGEYWFDEKTKTLYVYEPSGDYSIPLGGGFVTVENGADFISFVGLSFIGTRDDALTVDGDDITVEGCRIGDVCGQRAISGGKIRNFTLCDSELFHFSRCGIYLDAPGERWMLDPSGHVITNNLFYDFGLPLYFEGADGVALRHNVGTVVSHNEFLRGAHGAVRYDYCIDCVIEYNVFDGLMKNTQDFGAVYTYMSNAFRSNVIRYNLFKNIRSAGAQHGVYLDGADGQIIYGNLFYNAGSFAITFNGGRDNNAHDNVIIVTDKNDRSPFMYLGQRYEEALSDSPEVNSLLAYLDDRPKEGHPAYGTWLERWPELYNLNYDKSSAGQPDSVFSPVNYYTNNKIFGAKIPENKYYEMFGVKDGTEVLPLDENPYFVDPTFGDYRVRPDAGISDIHFEEMGRIS
ncbi:MAG: S-layer homology domain-containing protein [Clostridia bacterium]|nr:S-layer homology domain-containing protein [Clostridia bacterium]